MRLKPEGLKAIQTHLNWHNTLKHYWLQRGLTKFRSPNAYHSRIQCMDRANGTGIKGDQTKGAEATTDQSIAADAVRTFVNRSSSSGGRQLFVRMSQGIRNDHFLGGRIAVYWTLDPNILFLWFNPYHIFGRYLSTYFYVTLLQHPPSGLIPSAPPLSVDHPVLSADPCRLFVTI